ncbi:MAG: hypothetical protein JWO66_2843 [Candidatus Eremiobacteraeota bacterium]|nr:hypothetical protein [Candidatus Eremiobacteraeota bacterium]
MALLRVLAAAAAVFLAAPDGPPAQGAAPADSSGVPMVVKQTARCSAYAPPDWSVSSNPQASALDLQSGDRAMYAGWGVTSINRAMEQYYGPMYADPETSIRTLAGVVANKLFADSSGVQFVSAGEPFLNYFTLRRIASSRTQGIVFYRIYPGASPQFYTESVYLAIAEGSLPATRRSIALGVAVSIRCATQLVPSNVARSNGGRDKKGARPGCGGEGGLRGYNRELGTQYAHTAAGTNYLFDIGDYRNTGPDGPGYYKMVGNALTKLETGRSDDAC